MTLNTNGNGRKAVTWNVKHDVLQAFSKHCESKGMLPSRRVEILILKDIKENNEELGKEVELKSQS